MNKQEKRELLILREKIERLCEDFTNTLIRIKCITDSEIDDRFLLSGKRK
jgi:hypothetical protein